MQVAVEKVKRRLTLQDFFAEDFAVLVELVDDGNAGSEFQVDNLLARHALQLHDHRSKRVSVRGDEDLFTLEDSREDLLLVVGENSLGSELEGFPTGRGNVVRTSPNVNLFFAEFLAGVVLVQSGELSVIPFVESLILDDLEGGLIDFFENDIEGVVGSGEDGGVGYVELRESFRLERLSTEQGFGPAVFGQVGVLPSRKQVLSVPATSAAVPVSCATTLTSLFHSDSP